MGERLANCVRIEESHRALKGLKGQIKKWADRRHSLDVLDQYDAHVSVLESVLLPVLDALAAALDRIDSGRPVGEVYAQCRRTDDGVAFVGRIWEWFRAKFDQRDDPVIRRLLAAADEVVWSCYAEVFDNAAAVSGREVPRGLVPLPYIEFRFAPTATPRRLVPPDLRPRSGDEIMRVFLERLPLPLVGLPLAWLEAPWWLLLLGHEVGHQIQFELMPEFSLVTEFGELVSRAAAAGGELDASRWRAWSQEIFADLCLLCTGGPWGIWSVAGQDLADERTMLADRGPFPPPVVRLALLAAAAATLGVDGHAGMRGIDLNGLVADAEGTVKSDLALAPQIAIAALGHRLGGLGSFAELFAFDPDDFRPGGSVARWARALRTPGSSVHESPVRSGRLIACGAVAAWSEVAVIADAAERKKARKMLQKAVLRELTHGRQEATEGATRAAEPSAVPGPGDLAELRQLILAEFAQLGGEVVQLKGSVGRIEAGVSEITKVTAMVQDQLRRWTVSQETISGTPRLFTLTPVSKRGLDKAAVWQDTYQLTLWCEHDDSRTSGRPRGISSVGPRTGWSPLRRTPWACSISCGWPSRSPCRSPPWPTSPASRTTWMRWVNCLTNFQSNCLASLLPRARPRNPFGQMARNCALCGPCSLSLIPSGSSTGCILSRFHPAIFGGFARSTTRPITLGSAQTPGSAGRTATGRRSQSVLQVV